MTSDVNLKRPVRKDENKFRFYLAAYFIVIIFAFWWYKAGQVITFYLQVFCNILMLHLRTVPVFFREGLYQIRAKKV